ncbi:enoyl-CoA hydratase [Nocardioides aequoreus]|uniref:enoyl-CoA hydratase n=1 Tax=Nocardioides aequoreus TaxID=397278 RepID=UPI0004C35209|nr:enoyl-CoA hydratase [Nocardioides aequoreus]
MTEELLLDVADGVLTVTLNRPEARNALTWAMYDGLREACERVDADPDLRALVITGAGDRAFAAGTDIRQFADFATGQDGLDYEARIADVVDRLEAVQVPTVAAVRGYCVGGGLVLAAACDLRLATRSARFGAPIAATLGNCLSANSQSFLLLHLGLARTNDVLLRARMLDADGALAAGFVNEVCEEDELDGLVADTTATLLAHAPLTLWATKQLNRRMRRQLLVDDHDVVARAFGSDDFHRAVADFPRRGPGEWRGH